MKVHISNLMAPADDRCFRNLDSKHVKQLKTFYKDQTMCHTVLIGNIVGTIPLTQKELCHKLEVPGEISIETLGGNHTRYAIQELLNEGQTTIEQVTCRLYLNLDDKLALQLGYDHNVSNGLGKPTSFIDLCIMFRKEAVKLVGNQITKMSNSQVKEWKDILCNILSMNRKSDEFHNKYKVVLKLSRSNSIVWSRLQELAIGFEDGKIKGTPRGSLKISQLKEFYLLKEDAQLAILEEVIEKKDWKSFKSSVERYSNRGRKWV